MPTYDPFPGLPSDARLWIYALAQTLDADGEAALVERLRNGLSGWASHGRPVEGDAAVVAGRFLLVAAHLPAGGAISGCGIDAGVHAVEAAVAAHGVGLRSPLLVYYRDADGAVQSVGRPTFRSLVREGAVTGATPVFDLSITTVGDLREGRFERPAADAWHGRVFKLAAAAVG